MFKSSTSRVRVLAAAIWYGGGFILLWKATELLQQAIVIRPGADLLWLAVIVGAAMGALKARYLFARICRKNLQRIESLRMPKLWQCYRRRFFISLLLMIGIGLLLSILSRDRYEFLLGVAALDLSIGVALLGSSYVFWKG